MTILSLFFNLYKLRKTSNTIHSGMLRQGVTRAQSHQVLHDLTWSEMINKPMVTVIYLTILVTIEKMNSDQVYGYVFK